MFKSELKRAIAGVSLVTLVFIILLVTLALSLTTRYDIAARTVYACPTPAKTWSVGSAINNPSITKPTNGGYYGRNEVKCSCNAPTDSDHWTQGSSQGDSADSAVKATWSDNGAGGSWLGNINTGTDVTYIPAGTGAVRLTVTFDDTGTVQYDDSAKSTFVDITTGNAQLIFKVGGTATNTITRAQSGTFEVVDTSNPPQPISGASYGTWYFFGGPCAYETNNNSTWSGTIAQKGYATVEVTFGGHTYSVAKTISVTSRTGWSITPTCAQDNETAWGTFAGSEVVLGEHRDKESNKSRIIVPREGTYWEAGYATDSIASGPNKDMWYITSCTYRIDQETVINQYAKEGTTPPNPPYENWHEYNESKGIDSNGCLVGAKAHEYMGKSPLNQGHHKFLADREIQPGMDVKTEIEDNVSDSEIGLKTMTLSEVLYIDIALFTAASSPPEENSNWGPSYIWYYDFVYDEWNKSYKKVGF